MAANSRNTSPQANVRNVPQLLRDFALPFGFASLAAALWFSPTAVEIPYAAAARVDSAALVVEPRRPAMPDPPRILVEGRFENCNACHQIFRSAHDSGEIVNYHTDVRLEHGLNARCINCHDLENRERLVLRDGKSVAFAETPLLCAQCHGTTFRDWQNGTHGKTLGSWKTGTSEQMRLNCNQCHDPHSPRYEPYVPLPSPRTLRMGEQLAEAEHGGSKQSPLQRWLSHPAAPQDSDTQQEGAHK